MNKRKDYNMTTFLIIAIIVFICITAAVLDHTSGMDRPRSHRKPKKRQFSDAEMDYSKFYFKDPSGWGSPHGY